MVTKFRENVLLQLLIFLNQTLPMASARPTQYTRCVVSQTVIERDTNGIMELNMGV